MFESVEEVDQIETEPKSEEAKQVPKIPNGALQNGTSSPDSGHPSSRNFSVTSGLSDGSLSTEDSTAHDVVPRSAAVPQALQSEGLTEEADSQVKGKEKNKEEEEKEETETAENTKTEELVKASKETSLQPKTQETVQESIKTEGPECEDKDALAGIKGLKFLESGETEKEVPAAAATESKAELLEQSYKKDLEVCIEETAETNVEKMKETDRSKTPQEVLLAERIENISVDPPEVEKNLVFSADTGVLRAREAYYASQTDEAQGMTESDESPSAIEMEEIPKAKVSMVPWSRKGRCEASSFCEEEQGKPSPEGSEAILCEEPEMESLYPDFDSLAGAGDAKNEVTTQGSAGSTFSVGTYFY